MMNKTFQIATTSLVLFVAMHAARAQTNTYQWPDESEIIHVKGEEELEKNGERAVRLSVQGREALKKHDLRNAEKLFKSAIALNSNKFDAILGLAEVYEAQGRVDEACKYYDYLLYSGTDSARGYYTDPMLKLHYAILLSKNRKWENAVFVYYDGMSNIPTEDRDKLKYNEYEFSEDEVNSSRLEAIAHIQIGLRHPSYKFMTPEENLFHFKEAARLEPNLAIVQLYFGYGLEHVGKNVEAKAAYQKAIRYSDRDSDLQVKAKEFAMTVGQKGWFTPEPLKVTAKPVKKP